MDKQPVVVFDFETTGLSPKYGDRPIEVGAVRIEEGRVTDTFQRLMNPGFAISSFIESLTGISNELIAAAAPCEVVMGQFAEFIENSHLVAHNASFDLRFLELELNSLQKVQEYEAACSMLISRRIFPDAPDHKLKTLTSFCSLDNNNVFHRALDDAEKTGQLWLAMIDTMKDHYDLKFVPFSLMKKIEKMSRRKVPAFLTKTAKEQQDSFF